MTSADSCKVGEIEGVGTVGLVYVGKLLRMGCDSLLMLCVDLLEMGGLYGSRMGYHGNIQLKTKGRRGEKERRRQKA